MSEKGFYGGMFDFNRDGVTDAIERTIGYQVLEEMESQEDRMTEEDSDPDEKNT